MAWWWILDIFCFNPISTGMFCTKISWSWPSGFGEVKNVKSSQTDGQRDRQTDAGQNVIWKSPCTCLTAWFTKNIGIVYTCIACSKQLYLDVFNCHFSAT